MCKIVSIVPPVLLLVLLAGSAHAQTTTSAQAPAAPAAASRAVDYNDLRRNIYVMEGALQRAVSFGVQALNREIRSVMPEMIALTGEPQARGVYLEGYGVFFDVSVPILHQSMMWSLRTMLGQDPRGAVDALNTVRQFAKEVDRAKRQELETAIARLELEIGPVGDPTGSDTGVQALPKSPAVGAAFSLPGAAPQISAQNTPPSQDSAPQVLTAGLDKKYLKYMQDPNALNRAYTESVQRELINTMLDYGVMAIAPDEFLTVGARDNMQRDSLAPPDPQVEVVTILLRIKGADLAAFRARQIDRATVLTRIEIRSF